MKIHMDYHTAFDRGTRPKAGLGSLDIKIPSESHVCSTYIYEIFGQREILWRFFTKFWRTFLLHVHIRDFWPVRNSLKIFISNFEPNFAPRTYTRFLASEKFFEVFYIKFWAKFCSTYIYEIFGQREILWSFLYQILSQILLHVHIRDFWPVRNSDKMFISN